MSLSNEEYAFEAPTKDVSSILGFCFEF